MSVHLHTPELRESLAEGNIVIRLLSSYGDDNDDLPDSDRPDEVDQWYHVSLHFFSPYKPWLREVTWLSDIEDPRGHYHLLALHKYYTLWQMIDHIYLAASEWDIRFYKLVTAEMPIQSVDPCRIRVFYLPLVRRQQTFRARKPRVAPAPEVLQDLADLDGDEPDDADDDGDGPIKDEDDNNEGGDTESEGGDGPAPPTPKVPQPVSPAPSQGDVVSEGERDPSVDLFFSPPMSSSDSESGQEQVDTRTRHLLIYFFCLFSK